MAEIFFAYFDHSYLIIKKNQQFKFGMQVVFFVNFKIL